MRYIARTRRRGPSIREAIAGPKAEVVCVVGYCETGHGPHELETDGHIQTQTNSPTGGGLLPLPPMHAKDDEFSSMDNANGHTDPLPWLPDTRNNAPTPSANDVMDWSFPFTSGTTPKFPFSYQTPPSTSTGIGTSASGFANMAPPHQQPMSDIGSLLGGNNGAVQNNLGFTTLDDWFGQNLGDESGDVANGGLGGLDLQDFWMKVGPSEVSLVFRGHS